VQRSVDAESKCWITAGVTAVQVGNHLSR
jgi:hypothetical protein